MDVVMDSWAWLEYFAGNARLKKEMDGANLQTPVLVLAELERSLRRKGLSEDRCGKLISQVLERSIILPLDPAGAVNAGRIAFEQKMHLSDAVVYQFASADSPVATGDPDFKGRKHVVFIS